MSIKKLAIYVCALLCVSGGQLAAQETGAFAVVSAANFKSGDLAADMIVSGFSEAVPDVFLVVMEVPLPTVIGDASVVVTDSLGMARNSPLFGVFNNDQITGQVNFLIPALTALGEATFDLQVQGESVAMSKVNIALAAPGIFTANAQGTGVAAATFLRVLADSSRVEGNIFDAGLMPAPLDFGAEGDQLYLVLYGTGFRQRTDVAGAPAGVAQGLALELTAEVNGVVTAVLGVAPSTEFVGLDQAAIGPIDRSLLSGKGEVDIELSANGVSSGFFSAAFGGNVITPSPQLSGVTPGGVMAGGMRSMTVVGTGLSGISRVEILPASGLTVSNVQSMGTMATFDLAVAADAAEGTRQVAVVTPDGRSNRRDLVVSPPQTSGSAPVISNLVLQGSISGIFGLVVNAGFSWTDADGDISFKSGDSQLQMSARVEARLTGSTGECVFILGGSPLNRPGDKQGEVSVTAPTFRQDLARAGSGMGSVTLFDAAQNRSNTLTVNVQVEPIPGACNPNSPIVAVFP